MHSSIHSSGGARAAPRQQRQRRQPRQQQSVFGAQQQRWSAPSTTAAAAAARGLVPARPLPLQRLGGTGSRSSVSAAVASVEQRAITCELGQVLHTPHPSKFLNQNTSFVEEFRIRWVELPRLHARGGAGCGSAYARHGRAVRGAAAMAACCAARCVLRGRCCCMRWRPPTAGAKNSPPKPHHPPSHQKTATQQGQRVRPRPARQHHHRRQPAAGGRRQPRRRAVGARRQRLCVDAGHGPPHLRRDAHPDPHGGVPQVVRRKFRGAVVAWMEGGGGGGGAQLRRCRWGLAPPRRQLITRSQQRNAHN